jgi:hypothetical protein
MLQMSICDDAETSQEKSVRGSVINLVDSFNKKLAAKRKEIHFVEQILLNFDTELLFIARYFHHCWSLDKYTPPSKPSGNLKILRQVMAAKRIGNNGDTGEGDVDKQNQSGSILSFVDVPENGFIMCSNGKYLKLRKKPKWHISDCLDPIVYFNVEGEIIPILRSTILRVIPDSQLAVRVSGRWEGNQKDRDEGNLIVNCHKESFKKDPLEIYVNELSRDMIEETLDYLLIQPDSIKISERTCF